MSAEEWAAKVDQITNDPDRIEKRRHLLAQACRCDVCGCDPVIESTLTNQDYE